MVQFGNYTDEEKQEIKRKRLIRLVISGALAFIAALLFYPPLITSGHWSMNGIYTIKTWRLVTVFVLMVVSVAVGWKPNYETMFGDTEIYVEEP